jgi:3-hydroxy-9,10-secoandrosta-1,3,5(10)-triene-9,17-dione monooxygenase reductase component
LFLQHATDNYRPLRPQQLVGPPSRHRSAIRATGRLCINILAHDQHEVCARFATSGGDKFTGIDWSPGENEAPALPGALAAMEADLVFEHDAGDHTIVVARVTGLRAHEGGRPLLFYRGGYGGFEARLISSSAV